MLSDAPLMKWALKDSAFSLGEAKELFDTAFASG
jgi:hypothetical protein